MTALETALRQICGDLQQTRHSFALVGGLVVSARTEPRFTRDADIAVAVADDTEAEAMIRSLRHRGYPRSPIQFTGSQPTLLEHSRLRRDIPKYDGRSRARPSWRLGLTW